MWVVVSRAMPLLARRTSPLLLWRVQEARIRKDNAPDVAIVKGRCG